MPYAESMFIDSGAHSLYNIHVLGHKKREGKNGKELAKPKVRWSQGDFSYYDLKPGSEFRKYCDRYASFMKAMAGKGLLLANVDAISNPELTWNIQKYFEKEHGVTPIPIIHYGTPMKWVDKYVNSGRYDLLGVGGLGQGVSRHEYFQWADLFFTHICPKPSYLPVIKTHGFAMTSWELMCRYPWWSVDSATWVKLSAYGWLYIPRWKDGIGWRFDRPPIMLNFSSKSPRKEERQKHYDNALPEVRKTADRWLKHLGLVMGKEDKEGEMTEFGVASHHRARSYANLQYLTMLQNSRPEWPHPLDPKIVEHAAVKHNKGFGL